MKEDIDLSVEAQQIHETWLTKNGGYARDMTMRDEFAGRAMPAIYHHVERGGFERVSKLSYELADAMLKAREGK